MNAGTMIVAEGDPYWEPPRLIKLDEVARAVGLGKDVIRILVDQGRFPTPVRATKRTHLWRSAEINAWLIGNPENAAASFAVDLPKARFVNEAALVTQAPEWAGRTLSARLLAPHAVRVADLAHTAAGLYFLWREDVIVYVGQTKVGFSRILSHVSEATKTFDAVSFLRCPREQLDAAERAYINAFLPEYNLDPITMKARRHRDAEVRFRRARKAGADQ